MTRNQFTVIIVRSTNHALRAEKTLHQEGIGCKLIPVPRQISSDCGVCLRIQQVDTEIVYQVLEAAGLELESIHDL
jgi:hypothetical protein